MNKAIKLLSLITLFLIVSNCTRSIQHKHYGPGKARFNMISFDNKDYLLSIKEDNTYSLDKDILNMVLTVSNKKNRPSIFKLKNNNLLAFYIRNSQNGNILQKNIIKTDNYSFINNRKFFIPANQSIDIPFKVRIEKSIIESNKNLYCRLKMMFVHKLYRKNMLSIHLEKK